MSNPPSTNLRKVPVLDLTAQYQSIKTDIEKAVNEVLESGSYALGKNVQAFEEELAEYLGCKHVISCANGTDALYLALRAKGIGPGDEVVTVSHTFFATTESIVLAGAKPVYIDINEDDFNVDPSKIEAAITDKTKAIAVVHIYGQPCNIKKVMEVAGKHNLPVFEDTAQAIGARFENKCVGTFGAAGSISFYPTKNLGACGDAGAICTNEDEVLEISKQLRVHGSDKRYIHSYIGVNSRLDEVQAAVLRIKLKHLDKWNNQRREVANYYNELLKGVDEVQTPVVIDGAHHIYHQYTIKVSGRDDLQSKLQEAGVGTFIYYPIPVHMQKAMEGVVEKVSLPVTEKVAMSILSLPMFPELKKEDQNYVVENIKKILKK